MECGSDTGSDACHTGVGEKMEVMMKELKTILERAVAEQASDIFLVAGRPVSVRRKGVIAQLDEESLFPLIQQRW